MTPAAGTFQRLLQEESEAIKRSRAKRGMRPNEPTAGVAFSGGGVRSATFSVGVLQALAQFGLLRRFDYLSSVGSGSHIAAWLAAWIRREGMDRVDAQMGGAGATVRGEPNAVQRLRNPPAFLTPSAPVDGLTVATWSRNVLLNLIIVSTALAAILSLAHLQWLLLERTTHPVLLTSACVISTLTAVGLRLQSGNPVTGRSLFWRAVVPTWIAAALVGTDLQHWDMWELWNWAKLALFVATMFLIALSRLSFSPIILLAHTASSAAAGVTAAGVLWGVASWTGLTRSPQFSGLGAPVAISAVATAGLIYQFLMGRWSSREVRRLSSRLCQWLMGGVAIWVVFGGVWQRPLSILGAEGWAIMVGIGLFAASAAPRGLAWEARVFEYAARLAAYAFVIGLAGLIVTPLNLLIHLPRLMTPNPGGLLSSDSRMLVAQFGLATLLLLVSAFLMWRVGANDFTLQSMYAGRLTAAYLGPSAREGEADDLPLADLSPTTGYDGPIPLITAAANVQETDPTGQRRTRSRPFLFSSFFCGLEQPCAYRPTKEFAGGISLGTAMAIAGCVRNLSRPPSLAASVLWTIFDLRSGWWIASPSNEKTAQRSGPRTGLGYAIARSLLGVEADSAYLYLRDSGDLDNLGLYALVKRRCRWILVCDATEDPTRSMGALGLAVKTCRTELGAEIKIDLAPPTRGEQYLRSHAQLGTVRYSDGVEGLVLYIKASLTGDEPSELLQYADGHPEFPGAAGRQFGEPEFESYRRLGQHVIESLLTLLGDRQSLSEMPLETLLSQIRRQLQPGYREAPATSATELAPRPPDDPPDGLVDSILAGDCVLCAGSGLAAQAGLPTWAGFVNALLKLGLDRGVIEPGVAADLTAALATREFEAATDEITHQLPRQLIVEYTQALMAKVRPGPAHQVLADIPFLGALNTNFDELLRETFEARVKNILTAADADEMVASLRSKVFFVMNVLGVVSKPDTLLFTVREFRGLLASNLILKQCLVSSFLRYNMFFVGSSIRGIRDYMDSLELPQRPERRHYALVGATGELDPVEVRYLDRTYNVQVIHYRPRAGYPELLPFLQQLRSAVREKQERRPLDAPAQRPLLEAVHLTNIGPFEQLDLELTPSWNLFLGDNGVGKTVVLRAIAAALCGKDADTESVKRLLRISEGVKAGTIRLVVGSREYIVELQRDEDGNVQIKSTSLSPLKLDNWLVLGFSALRSIPTGTPKGPGTPPSPAPSPSDLRPIITGEPDQRISDLKQWIVNLDYSKRRGVLRAARQLKRFFDVLQALTPDMRLEFHSINEKLQIEIVTDSGIVPLDAVSQGTGSVMCWIGSLVERLYEAHGLLDEPEEGGALVLVDEIDAHMHPKWQRAIVSSLRLQFPRVQFIATTHSPLIVGGLGPNELYHFRRDLELDEVAVTRMREGFQGYSADQILTSPVFNLPTSVDLETERYRSLYARKLIGDVLDAREEEDLRMLATKLHREVEPGETDAQRKANQLLMQAMEKRLDEIELSGGDSALRSKIIQEARLILAGASRPPASSPREDAATGQ